MKKQRRNSEISADSFQCKYAEIQTYFKQPVDKRDRNWPNLKKKHFFSSRQL